MQKKNINIQRYCFFLCYYSKSAKSTKEATSSASQTLTSQPKHYVIKTRKQNTSTKHTAARWK